MAVQRPQRLLVPVRPDVLVRVDHVQLCGPQGNSHGGQCVQAFLGDRRFSCFRAVTAICTKRVTSGPYGYTLRKRVTSGPYGYTLRKRVTSGPYGYTLRKRVTSGPYGYTLRKRVTSGPYGYTLRKQVTSGPYD